MRYNVSSFVSNVVLKYNRCKKDSFMIFCSSINGPQYDTVETFNANPEKIHFEQLMHNFIPSKKNFISEKYENR